MNREQWLALAPEPRQAASEAIAAAHYPDDPRARQRLEKALFSGTEIPADWGWDFSRLSPFITAAIARQSQPRKFGRGLSRRLR